MGALFKGAWQILINALGYPIALATLLMTLFGQLEQYQKITAWLLTVLFGIIKLIEGYLAIRNKMLDNEDKRLNNDAKRLDNDLKKQQLTPSTTIVIKKE